MVTPDMATPAQALVDALILEYGGLGRWQSVEAIDFSLSSAGLAFALHGQAKALLGLQVRVFPDARKVELRNYQHADWLGVWTPTRVCLVNAEGNETVARDNPRTSFSQWSRQVRWDALDMLYFAGYALWNYFSFPFLLKAPGVTLQAVTPGKADTSWLDVSFDGDFPTHSAKQSFQVDASGHLLRHDYTADVIGTWATAANYCQASVQVEGLRFYTRRRVYPRFGRGVVLPMPTLVWIDARDVKLVSGMTEA